MQQSTATSTSVRSELIPDRSDLVDGQILHLPESVLAEIQGHAARLERSVGWCLWMAWCLTKVEFGEPVFEQLRDDPLLAGDKLPRRVEMPLGTWRHLTHEAERLDRSKSWLLARAWVMARSRFVEAAEAQR